MSDEKKLPNVGGPAKPPKLQQDIQLTDASQLNSAPLLVQHPPPGRKPLFRH